jgi:hypothetical protein
MGSKLGPKGYRFVSATIPSFLVQPWAKNWNKWQKSKKVSPSLPNFVFPTIVFPLVGIELTLRKSVPVCFVNLSID